MGFGLLKEILTNFLLLKNHRSQFAHALKKKRQLEKHLGSKVKHGKLLNDWWMFKTVQASEHRTFGMGTLEQLSWDYVTLLTLG